MPANFEEKLTKTADRIMNCILLGFFWFATSFGIVTIGASTSALSAAMESYLYHEDQRPLKTYFSAFRQYFRISTIVWMLHLAVIAVLVIDLVYYWYGEGSLDTVGAVIMCVLLTMIAFELIMIFICIPYYNISTVREAFAKSFDIAFTCMLESFMILVLNAAVPIAVFFLFRGAVLFFAGISSYLSWQILPKMFTKYKFKKGTREEMHH